MPGRGFALLTIVFALLGTGVRAASLRVGIEPNTQPLSLIAADGKPAGFAVEVVQAVAQDRKLEVEFVVKRWAELYADFRAGRLDVLAACGKNPEREPHLWFSIPHLDLPAGVFVNATHPPLSSLAALGSKVIGTTQDSLAQAYATRQGWKRWDPLESTCRHASLSIL